MSTIVLLSSSPPRVFARSPTPVGSSSPPLPSASALLKENSPGRNKFKTIATARDGFQHAFVSARTVLSVKNGAENKPITSPGKTRFKSSQGDSVKIAPPKLQRLDSKEESVVSTEPVIGDTSWQSMVEEQPMVVQITSRDVKRTKKRAKSPLRLPKATARRTDWTPPRPTVAPTDQQGAAVEKIAFPRDLNDSFGYEGAKIDTACYEVDVKQSTKRRKLDAMKTTPSAQKEFLPKPTTKRNKSPAKKPLTITGLATASFMVADESVSQALTMLDYLTGSQIQTDGASESGQLDDKVTKTKEAVKRLRAGKKVTRSSLRSPTTAMKSFEEQEAIFGSASQLARSESPTFLRDTIEALKQSESNILSDPISPLRPTQTISTENTPQMGTSRFRRSRNLWAAAGRDDDNALMHVDCVDLSDTPAIRNAFAGKDVLVQQQTSRSASPSKEQPRLRGGGTAGPLALCTVLDIDDIVTPLKGSSFRQATSIHTSAHPPTLPNEDLELLAAGPTTSADVVIPVKKPTKPTKPRAKKPNYAGFTDEKLKKQISAYGFKTVKNRDKMVDLLERCWDEKHSNEAGPPSGPVSESEPPISLNREGSGYGDFLSNVHDITARPVPKTKKVKVPRKKKDASTAEPAAKKPRAPRKKKEEMLDENGQPVKKPRAPRKKKEATGAVSTEATPKKPPAKRKAKTSALSAELVTTSDDVDILSVRPPVIKGKSVPPEATKEPKTAADVLAEALPSPPPTYASSPEVPLAKTQISKPAASSISPTKKCRASTTAVDTSTTPSDPELPNLDSKITTAILHETRLYVPSASTPSSISSSPSTILQKRNHITNPTWYEKILLYDPIVLEDLAAWLNTTGLGLVGEDREVSALDVRAWCESRGVCCLWRGGWRGNHREAAGGAKGAKSAVDGGLEEED